MTDLALGTYGSCPTRQSAAQLSAAIGIARVMGILGIVYVHAWTGLSGGMLTTLNHDPQNLMRWGLVELLGRSAVPLLGIISGWLVAGSVSKRPVGEFIKGKARTILLPMVLWNILAILFVSGSAFMGLIKAPLPSTLHWIVDEVFCLFTPDDINVQMSFLRDLFICMLAAPLLARLPNKALAFIAGVALVWVLSGANFILMLRPAILFFFIIGMLVRRTNLANVVGAQPVVLMAVPYIVLAALKIWAETAGVSTGAGHPVLMAGLDTLMRLATAAFFWSLAWRFAANRAGEVLLRFEPYAFLLFCSHLIMIWLGGPLIGTLTGPLGSPLYPVFFLLQPVLAVTGAVMLGRFLMENAPDAAFILSGGRLKARAHGDPAPQMPARY